MNLLYIKLSFCCVACHGGDSFEDRTAIVFRKVSGEGGRRKFFPSHLITNDFDGILRGGGAQHKVSCRIVPKVRFQL